MSACVYAKKLIAFKYLFSWLKKAFCGSKSVADRNLWAALTVGELRYTDNMHCGSYFTFSKFDGCDRFKLLGCNTECLLSLTKIINFQWLVYLPSKRHFDFQNWISWLQSSCCPNTGGIMAVWRHTLRRTALLLRRGDQPQGKWFV